jgi:hypothetical protein
LACECGGPTDWYGAEHQCYGLIWFGCRKPELAIRNEVIRPDLNQSELISERLDHGALNTAVTKALCAEQAGLPIKDEDAFKRDMHNCLLDRMSELRKFQKLTEYKGSSAWIAKVPTPSSVLMQ